MSNFIENLRNLNSDVNIYSINDFEFKKYGRVLDVDTREIVSECKRIELPKQDSQYIISSNRLENLKCSEALRNMSFGGCDAQIGICHGYNSKLNGLEFHRSSEINIAVTPLILILGLQYEMEDREYASENVKVFYLEKGNAVEIYATTLHFCPCQVDKDGFSCVVILPKKTNEELEAQSDDRLLYKKNKWIICHDKNDGLIEKGIYPGIHGKNIEIKYKGDNK